MQVWTSGKFHLQYNIKNRLIRKTTIKEEKGLCTKHTDLRIKTALISQAETTSRCQPESAGEVQLCEIWFTRNPERLQTNNIEK